MGSPASERSEANGSRTVADLPEPPDDSIVGTPPRRPGSIRRTANINMVWPDGAGTPLQLRGRARDLRTTREGGPEVLAQAEILVDVGDQRTVNAISVVPDRDGIQALVGSRGGGGFRSALDAALPGERQAATPLYFLLDDIAGATLIAGFAWSQARAVRARQANPDNQTFRTGRDGRIICSGLRPDGYHDLARRRGDPLPHYLRRAGDLSAPDDPWAWHQIEPAPAVCMRRRRRLDIWTSGLDIELDGHFRDSMWDPDHDEIAVHEYTVRATISRASHRLIAIEAVPRVLPFPECPWAAPHATMLVGSEVDVFRTRVQDTLTEIQCCTHLNDMVRGLAEVPHLVDRLETAGTAPRQGLGHPRLLD
jgi:hypothetical protein